MSCGFSKSRTLLSSPLISFCCPCEVALSILIFSVLLFNCCNCSGDKVPAGPCGPVAPCSP